MKKTMILPTTYHTKRLSTLVINMTLLVIFTILFFGCKDYLDVKPDDKLSVADNLPALQALLDNTNYMNQRTSCYDEATADDYFLPLASYNSVGLKGQAAYLWKPYANEYVNDYATSYFTVYQANVCLEALENITRAAANAQDWDNVKGSALFYRAFAYLKLTWTYAQAFDESSADQLPGIILRTGSDPNVPSVRSTVRQSYQQVIDDLNAAAQLLPQVPKQVMRPSKIAVNGLLARTYLSMRRYDLAKQYADAYLASKSDLMDYNTISTTAASPFQSFNTEVAFHADITTYGYVNCSPVNSRVDTMLYQTYATNDLRRTIFYAASGSYFQFKGSYATRTIFGRPLFTGLATDEMYLIKAECLVRAGSVSEGLELLNRLLAKRWRNSTFVPYATNNMSQALQWVLTERRKELVFRGLRWIDIKRLNLEGAGIILKRVFDGQTYTVNPNSYVYALALPADVVALSGVSQNVGW